MCGIYGLVQYTKCKETKRRLLENVKKSQVKMRHRGPDWEGMYNSKNEDNVYMAHHRLSIVDPKGGSQPIIWNLEDNDKDWVVLAVNGEIYNCEKLENEKITYTDGKSKTLKQLYEFKTGSDCECLMAQYQSLIEKVNKECLTNLLNVDTHELWNTSLNIEIPKFLNKINGMFAFILYDNINKQMLVARDPFGICPLYYGFDSYGGIHFSSEMKAMPDDVIPQCFPAGHYMYFTTGEIATKPVLIQYYYGLQDVYNKCTIQKKYDKKLEDVDLQLQLSNCRKLLTDAVSKRLRTDVPFGMLLSGGLDSSLVCSIANKLIKYNQDNSLKTNMNSIRQITTFAIGLEGGPDLIAAEKVAKFLGTKHYGFTFTIEEGLSAIRDVIWHLETYDMTTIRAATPMYLLSRRIKSMGFKMVLSGEASDECLGGYLYFLSAPSEQEHASECLRRMQELQYSDNLRANKSTMAWGIEARVPFQDKNFVEWAMSLPSECKHRNDIEKWILREAFNTFLSDGTPEYLPKEILWRQKEQFSDAVGYNWIDSLKQLAENEISDYVMSLATERWKVNTPVQKDEYLVRAIFEELFSGNGRAETVHKSTPNTSWKGINYDSSGRAQKHHNSSWDKK